MSMRFCAILVLSCGITSLASAQDQSQPTAQQTAMQDELAKMHWVGAGDYTLPESKSKLTIPPDFFGLFGAEARRALELTNGTSHAQDEALLVDKQDDLIVFDWQPEGYVSSDDWADVDATAMLRTITEHTATENIEREKRHLSDLTIAGWLKEPTLDRASNTAFWTIEVQDSGKALVNSTALRLARQGYERIVWVADKARYGNSTVLQTMLTANDFPIGTRYVDHATGDKMAGYGVAALVATVAGAKVAKAAGFVGLLVLLKKAWLIPVVLFGAFRRKIVGFFKRSKAPATPGNDQS
jgi:uncharacterized membrane-anchored protein